jgi:hypothetical protein
MEVTEVGEDIDRNLDHKMGKDMDVILIDGTHPQHHGLVVHIAQYDLILPMIVIKLKYKN